MTPALLPPLRNKRTLPRLGLEGIDLSPPIRQLRHSRPRKTVRPQDLAREIFINPARLAPVLRSVISDYAAKTGITLKQKYESASLSAGMSLVASTGGVTLLPLYVQNVLIPSVVARPLQGEPRSIELVMGYNKSNTSPLLKRFVSRAEELVAKVQAPGRHGPAHTSRPDSQPTSKRVPDLR